MVTRKNAVARSKPRSQRTVPMPPPELQLLSVKQAGAILGVGHDLIYRLIMGPSPELYSFLLGGRRLVPRRAIERFIEAKMAQAGGSPA